MTTLAAESTIRTPEAPMPRNGSGSPTVAMVLGGGGARGFAHIHALEALDELGLTPAVIAGSSKLARYAWRAP